MYLKKIVHIIIITITLIGTIGFNLSKHYSSGELFSVSFFGEAEKCCEFPCDCCSDESEYFKTDNDFITSDFEFEKIHILELFNISAIETSLNLSNENNSSSYFYNKYLPPKTPDKQAQLATFLC